MSRTPALLSIGQAAERTGLSVHTLRFYEKEGLLINPVRRVGGQRVYSESDLSWLYLCTRLRASGMPLPAIREYVALVQEGESTMQGRLALLQSHRERVSAQIEELQGCLALVSRKVALYEAQLADDGSDPLWTGSCVVGLEGQD
ncbi:DNA-binding transcriptional regulator, MerR family [Saccharopolyspora kobensis]|uniref:Transcriptional regulator, MerR family n=1 Tax=Saccharopolyspora kobensis TaxID=146035 RepID=A0A1H6DZZ5_9PSEU|nr:MerR family transcriptional regulator [Saccharopolyspora kobensis]SEG90524.1 DNA-binding transcriptional regulator, MerR family [Saccharopolyspora kobensis]SFD91923.1 transcriptional regulator, MerR family [Saccharopolyspora kobensis]